MIHALGVLSLCAYMIALVLFSFDVFQDSARRTRLAEWFFLAGFITHTLLAFSTLINSGTPLLVGRGDFYLFLAWGIPVAYGMVRKRMRYPIVGAFLSAATIVFLASSSYLIHLTDAREGGLGIGFQGLHIFPALIAELCLVVAFVLSVIFLIQERRIKRKRSISAALSAPSLDLLGIWNLRLVNGGFVAMSFAIVSGSVWALFHQRNVFTSDPFQWMGFLVWVLFVVIHLMRSIRGRSVRVLAHMTIVAGMILMITLGVFLLFGEGVNHAAIYLS